MKIALDAKDKLAFVNGKIVALEEGNKDYEE